MSDLPNEIPKVHEWTNSLNRIEHDKIEKYKTHFVQLRQESIWIIKLDRGKTSQER